MSCELHQRAESRLKSALLLSDSGEYGDALLMLCDALRAKTDAAIAAAALRQASGAAGSDTRGLFAANDSFRVDGTALCSRLADILRRSSAGEHRVTRKEFLDALDDSRKFFQDADRYIAGEAMNSTGGNRPDGGDLRARELLKLSDRKLGSAVLLFDAGKYDECLLVLCDAFKVKLRAFLLASLGRLPGDNLFALFADQLSPERAPEQPAPVSRDYLALAGMVESLCAKPPSLDRTACLGLLEDISTFFRDANAAARARLALKTRTAAGRAMRRAVPWLAGIAALIAASLVVSAILPGGNGGLTGTYYGGTDLAADKVAFKRKDATVDFNWTGSSPDLRLPQFGYSVRWTGKVLADTDREYNFYVLSDDGVRLWVDNVQIIDNWRIQGETESSGKIKLKQGWHDLRLDYYQAHGDASVRLLWDGGFLAHRVIPADHLKP